MKRDAARQRGVTLTELVVVMALASVVMVGLVAFYFGSQATWVDASVQALAQRDGTLLLEAITGQVRPGAAAEVLDIPDSLHQLLIIREPDGRERARFSWNPGDSLLYRGEGDPSIDRGPVTGTRVDRFQVTALDSMVEVRQVRVLTANGQTVTLATAAAFYNR